MKKKLILTVLFVLTAIILVFILCSGDNLSSMENNQYTTPIPINKKFAQKLENCSRYHAYFVTDTSALLIIVKNFTGLQIKGKVGDSCKIVIKETSFSFIPTALTGSKTVCNIPMTAVKDLVQVYKETLYGVDRSKFDAYDALLRNPTDVWNNKIFLQYCKMKQQY